MPSGVSKGEQWTRLYSVKIPINSVIISLATFTTHCYAAFLILIFDTRQTNQILTRKYLLQISVHYEPRGPQF